MNYAGSPLNMEGDINYAKLKAIENGASIYFTLSYQNTQLLKEDTLLSQYYSVRYDIWFDDVVEVYDELNREMGELQNKYIVHHEFLSGMRVPDTNELAGDLNSVYNDVLDYQNNKLEYEVQKELEEIADARDMIASVEDAAEVFIKNCLYYYTEEYDNNSSAATATFSGDAAKKIAEYMEADSVYNEMKARYDAATAEEKAEILPLLKTAEENRKSALGSMKTKIRNTADTIYKIEKAHSDLQKLLEDARKGMGILRNTEFVDAELLSQIEQQLAKAEALRESVTQGFDFDSAVEKVAIETFLYTHASTLLVQANGGNSTTGQVGIVGKAQALYEMLGKGSVGLTENSAAMKLLVEYLKTTGATEEEIAELETSCDLGKCIRALLADYEFDPTFSDEEIDAYINEYAENWIYSYVASYASASTLLPGLNIEKLYFENGTEDIYLTRENYKVLTDLITKLTSKLNAIKDWDAIVGKDLVTEVLYTEAEWKAITKSISDKILDRGAVYATPETMEEDIDTFARAFVYIQALKKLQPVEKKTLNVMTVKSRVSDSLTFLTADVVKEAALLNKKDADYYGQLYNLIEAQLATADVDQNLDKILQAVPASYGATKDDLKVAYWHAAIAALRTADLLEGSKKEEVLDYGAISDQAVIETIQTKLEEAACRVGDEQAAILGDIKAAMEAAGVDNAWLDDSIASAVRYLQYISLTDIDGYVNYYYDEIMAKMDHDVRALVATTDADTIAEIFGTLMDEDIAKKLAEIVGAVESKYAAAVRGESISKNVTNYFVYLMLEKAGLDVYDSDPTVEYMEGKVNKAASTAVKDVYGKKGNSYNKGISDMITAIKAEKTTNAVGGISYVLSDTVLKAAVDNAYELYIEKMTEEIDEEYLRASLEAYISYHYYNAVVTLQYTILPDEIDDSRCAAPEIYVAEIYPNRPMYEVNESLITLMVSFLPESAEMGTWEDIKNAFFPQNQDEEETTQEISKYLSDNGRIVAVSYGDYVEDGYTVCKTFVLNYNDFAITVKYAGVTYTIPAYDYVVVRP